MFQLSLLIISHCLLAIGSLDISTTTLFTPTTYAPTPTTLSLSDQCQGAFPGSLRLESVTFKGSPTPAFAQASSIKWDSYGSTKPQVMLGVCDFTTIMGLTFTTENVQTTDIAIDGNYFNGGVNQFGNVIVLTGYDALYNLKSGSAVKITLTPENYSLPVEFSNLEIQTCSLCFLCLDVCSLYVIDPETDCKLFRCSSGDPCSEVKCSEGQECRLITGEDLYTFPGAMTEGVQLWGCVEKNRTNYGCTCNGNYGIDENQCPTCNCGEESTTTTTESFVP